MPIEKTISIVSKALRTGIQESLIRWCLLAEGISEKNTDIIVRWAKKQNLVEDEAFFQDWEFKLEEE